ncbi:hypothetical protein CcaCcLH18_09121 [Colletotrichum camelliae]|nr:hypothetical protein CcaCcLH18_09121 [Colletotrichum camelliae]
MADGAVPEVWERRHPSGNTVGHAPRGKLFHIWQTPTFSSQKMVHESSLSLLHERLAKPNGGVDIKIMNVFQGPTGSRSVPLLWNFNGAAFPLF